LSSLKATQVTFE